MEAEISTSGPGAPEVPGFCPTDPIRVVVVDRDEDMGLFLRTLLEQDRRFSIAGVATTGAEALALVAREQPHAVVVELQPTAPDSLETVGLLRRAAPGTKIVVCSAFPDPYTLVDLLNRGADEYIDTGLAWSELIPTIAGLCHPGDSS